MTPARLGQRSLGDIVATQPAAARVLDRAGLDYCCHGDVTLEHACAAAGVDMDALVDEIEAIEPAAGEPWASLPPDELAAHIVATHHRYLREELPAVTALASKVAEVHGARHPEVRRVLDLVTALRADLEPHLDREERILFPAIRALFHPGRHPFPFGTVANPIRVMAADHDRAGGLLATLRTMTSGYAVPADGCASYRSLYARLEALELDTHVHIHKENHVLFPAAVRAEAAGAIEQQQHPEVDDDG